MKNFDIDLFISKYITKRSASLFGEDIKLNTAELRAEIAGSQVLVIGGAGTIGSNYIKSILPFRPSKVVVVDTNENGLTELVRTLRSTPNLYVPDEFITYPISLGNKIFDKIYRHYKPFDIIANFAAHKHVRSEKDIFSIEAMIENNLINALRLLKLIEPDRPRHFFCVSTDKAANPVNIMGASKKLMEELVIDFSANINCTTARFANVAFSNGSLLDGFLQRMMQRQPLAVPADIKRYFVSPAESGDICMLASVLGNPGDIFFPKLRIDELTSFFDITTSFVNEFGYSVDICTTDAEAKEKMHFIDRTNRYPVVVSNSNTSGEKLYEEFFTDDEVVDMQTYQSLAVARTIDRKPAGSSAMVIQELEQLLNRHYLNKEDIVNLINKHIPNFAHVEKGMSLDHKM